MCPLEILISLDIPSLSHLLEKSFLHGSACRVHPYQIEDLAISSMVVYLTFEKRMHDLMRGWRLQGREIDQQLGRFADGLFQDIQREVRLFSLRSGRQHRLILAEYYNRPLNAKRPSRSFVKHSLEGPKRRHNIVV